VGDEVAICIGWVVGVLVGVGVGWDVGVLVGVGVGWVEGVLVGIGVGADVGVAVGMVPSFLHESHVRGHMSLNFFRVHHLAGSRCALAHFTFLLLKEKLPVVSLQGGVTSLHVTGQDSRTILFVAHQCINLFFICLQVLRLFPTKNFPTVSLGGVLHKLHVTGQLSFTVLCVEHK